MHKKILPLLLAASLLAPLSHAQFNLGDGDRLGGNPHLNKALKNKKEESKTPKKVRSVKEALKQMSFFNGEPNPNAQYYIFLRSASWCGPCRAEMPEIVEIYKDIKASKKVELILWSADNDLEKGKKFLTDHKAPFPGTMDVSILTELKGGSSVPHAYVLDKKGKLLLRGHGSILKNWKYATLDYRKNRKEIQARMEGLTAAQ